MDYAEKQTEKSLNSLERRLKAEYERAYIEAKIRADEYFEQYYARYDAEWKKWKAGLYTDAQFKAWQQTQIARGEKFEQLVSDLANTYVNANQVAAELTNGKLAGVYTVNANYTAYQISKDYDGISFGLVDENTIKVLMDEDKNFTDFKTLSVNPKRNYEWNTKQVRSCITSAILQGKGIKEQTDSLMLVQKRNRNAAIRNARTAFGSAQNAGKLESMKQANDMGLDTQKMWVSAGDNKVRDSHAHLDGQIRATDEKFDNGLLFPLDPDGAPAEVYNCRCGMKYVNKKYHPEWKSKEDYSETKHEGESYQAWLKRMKDEANAAKVSSPSIESRNHAMGKPSAVVGGAKLNNRQQRLNDILTTNDTSTIVKKRDVNMKDLSALSASNGVEYALLTRKNERMVIRGDLQTVGLINDKTVESYREQGWKWSGHTHVVGGLVPSNGDLVILELFHQKKSLLYDHLGNYTIINLD